MKSLLTVKTFLLALAASVALFLAVDPALADKIYKKDGTVIQCTILEEKGDLVKIRLENGQTDWVSTDDIRRIERDDPKPAEAAKPTAEPSKEAASKEAAKQTPAAPASASGKTPSEKRAKAVSGATRVAILNFGPPSSWQGICGNTVGVQITAKAWRDAIPALEKDNVDVVVVRINSGGGALSEMAPFHEVYREYKRKFRTVTWVESAISCACMSPWIIEEWYFMPEGNAGANTAWSGAMQAMGGVGLISLMADMEKISAEGKHDHRIMRSMEILEPLSCNIDPNTNIVTWFQDVSGKYIVNPQGRILVLNAADAEKYRFSRGTAATKEELAQKMGLNEVEWVGAAAAKIIDDSMKKNDEAEKRWEIVYQKYMIAVNGARALQGEQNVDRRRAEVGVARRHLNELEKLVSVNPNIADVPPGWFREQRELLKELAQ